MEKIAPWKYNLKRIENIQPSLRYDGSIPFETWKTQAREKLAQLLGMHNITKPENGAFEIMIGASSRDIRLSATVKIALPETEQLTRA